MKSGHDAFEVQIAIISQAKKKKLQKFRFTRYELQKREISTNDDVPVLLCRSAVLPSLNGPSSSYLTSLAVTHDGRSFKV